MLLYMFISCEKRMGCYNRIMGMMTALDYGDFIIVKGGTETNYNPLTQILTLDCNDYYEGLPEKVLKAFKFVHDDARFSKYTQFCKVDDDIRVNRLIVPGVLTDYCGILYNYTVGNRRWHIGKCSTGSPFNTMPYTGKYVPWCLGGNGYFVSRRSLDAIVNDTTYKSEIYEDLYVAKLLRVAGILPTHIPDLLRFLFSKDHPALASQQ